jgi:nucleotidyltransferase/DNA polymerase involved in DNA repair
MPRFFCLSLPDFPAWAAARNDTDLRGKPLVIYASGKVIAASPAAHAAGIQTGWSVSRAQARMPGLIALPQDHQTTHAAWQEVLAALYDLTPCIESIRPGLALADIRPESIVIPLLREWQAHGGSARGGLADDRTAAELAALTASPGSLRRIKPGRSAAYLQCVPVNVLQHVGIQSRTIERIGWFGWKSVGHLRALTRRQCVAQFADGETLYHYAQADDVRPVATYKLPPTIRMHYAFEQAVREPGEIELVLHHLIEQACQELNHRTAGSLAVGLETPQGWLYGRRLLRDGITTTQALETAAFLALEAVLRRAKAVSGVELQLGALTALQPVQEQLFEPSRPPIDKALHAVEHRHPGMMRRIVIVERNAYLPEWAHRLEPIVLASEKVATRSSAPKRARRQTPTGAR